MKKLCSTIFSRTKPMNRFIGWLAWGLAFSVCRMLRYRHATALLTAFGLREGDLFQEEPVPWPALHCEKRGVPRPHQFHAHALQHPAGTERAGGRSGSWTSSRRAGRTSRRWTQPSWPGLRSSRRQRRKRKRKSTWAERKAKDSRH